MKSESEIGNVPSRRHRLSGRTPRLYRWCDTATEFLVYFMVVFSPWAFGTTQPWAIWTMNATGLTLGLLLVGKRLIEWKTGYAPARWGSDRRRWLTTSVVVLTALLPLWCLVSAVNARADFDTSTMQFDYRDRYVRWLPHSYDADSTWFAFWQVLGLWCAFWALRNWLLGKTRRERVHTQDEDAADDGHSALPFSPMRHAPVDTAPALPARLRRLLWVLCVNGGLLALEGTFQRLSGTNKLLWLVEPRHVKTAEAQFGPYAYRGNAAQYLNLLWPVCLGFGLHIQHRSSMSGRNRFGSSPDVVLFLICALMIAAPLTMGTRGGTLVTVGMLVVAIPVVLVGMRRHLHRRLLLPLGIIVLVVATGGVMGWKLVGQRLLQPASIFPLAQPISLDGFSLQCQFDVPTVLPPRVMYLVRLRSQDYDRGRDGGQMYLQMASNGGLVAAFGSRVATNRSSLRVTVPGFQAQFGGQRVDLRMSRGDQVALQANGTLLSNSIRAVPATGFLGGGEVDYVETGRQETRGDVRWARLERVNLYDAELPLASLEPGQGSPATRDVLPTAAPLLALRPAQLQRPALWLGLLGDQSVVPGTSTGRSEIYAIARRMAKDFVELGSGPGTFGPLYGLYRADLADAWAWYVHNDYLETRITWGRVGSGVAALALLGLATLAGLGGGIGIAAPMSGLIGVAMTGCLTHASVDYPFQVYSVAALFFLLVCMGSALAAVRLRYRVQL